MICVLLLFLFSNESYDNVHNRKTVVHGGTVIPHPFGISLFEHNVFFTDWTRLAVMKANKFTDSSPQVVYGTSQTPYGVSVIHQLKQPHGKPPPSLSEPNFRVVFIQLRVLNNFLL